MSPGLPPEVPPAARPAVTPVSRDRLLDRLIGAAVATRGGSWPVLALDGAPSTGVRELAVDLVERLGDRGRPALHVDVHDFLRPASIRWEHGRDDPEAYYERWFDQGALRREVLLPLGPGGTGRVLARYWDPVRDRSARAEYRVLPPGAVVAVSGPFLLADRHQFDVAVHGTQSPTVMQRRTPPEQAWTLPAHARYAAEVDPAALADLVVVLNDPARPALAG